MTAESSTTAAAVQGTTLVRRPMIHVTAWAVFLTALGTYARLAPLTAGFDDKDWSHLWLGGRMIVAGHADRLYDPKLQLQVFREADPEGRPPAVWMPRNDILGSFNYPPPAALAYSLLSRLPMRQAAVVNAYLTIALAVVVAWLVSAAVAPRIPFAVVGCAVLLYPPFFVNLSLGQNALVTLAVVCAAWYLLSRSHEVWGGVLLGLLICKPNWFLAMLWIPLCFGRWRVVAGMAAGGAAVTMLTAAVTGIQPFVDYLGVFRNVARLHDLPDYALGMKYNGLGVFRKWLGVSAWSSVLGWAAAAAVVLVTWKTGRGLWHAHRSQFHLLMACCVTASLWVNPHVNHYDLMPLAVCSAVTLLGPGGRSAAAAIVLLCYVAVPWDHSWSWGHILPIPSVALIALWVWFVRTLQRARACNGTGPALAGAVPRS